MLWYFKYSKINKKTDKGRGRKRIGKIISM